MNALAPHEAALIAEACTRSGVVWVRTVDQANHVLAWHVWHADAVHVVHGVEEQVLPLMSGQVEVVVPSKETRARLVTFVALAQILPARSPEWNAAADALAAARLNAHDPAGQRDRWASGALVTRLVPVYLAGSVHGSDASGDGALPPLASGGTSLSGYRPAHLTRRGRRGAEGRRGPGGLLSRALRPRP